MELSQTQLAVIREATASAVSAALAQLAPTSQEQHTAADPTPRVEDQAATSVQGNERALQLTQNANSLVALSVAPSTRKTYQPGIKAYTKFASAAGFNPLHPGNEDIVRFITSLSQTVSAATIKVYLAATRYYLLSHGSSTEGLRSQRLTAVLKGVERKQFDTRQAAPLSQASRQRPAVSTSDMLRLKEHLSTSTHPAGDKAMIWAAVATAFNGLLRVSEYASTSASSTPSVSTLTVAQVRASDTRVVIELGPTKAAQFGGGGTILLRPNANKDLCPVTAIQDYRRKRKWPNARAPFFIYNSGRQLSQKDINFYLKRALGPGVSSHSLRKGGATELASRSAPEWQLQAAGRWRSSAYKQYIHTTAGLPSL
ncbi:uncharacterized protein LOC135819567 [Sycon ciliatum]|uniref:uncharacterized protein LOC135819567 n=1 Tax=Sycon ciliatum TaxID=27933 RepID=UPI0031F6148E